MNTLSVEIKNSPAEAPNYNTNGEGFQAAVLTKAIIVKKGTEAGNDTIDLQFVDKDGNKYVAMVTANLLKTVTGLTTTDSPLGIDRNPTS